MRSAASRAVLIRMMTPNAAIRMRIVTSL
jgi:hypothetical protein